MNILKIMILIPLFIALSFTIAFQKTLISIEVPHRSYDKSSLLALVINQTQQTEQNFHPDALFAAKENSKDRIHKHIEEQLKVLEQLNPDLADSIIPDEFLRGQLWNLRESIGIFVRLFPQDSNSAIKIKAEEIYQKRLKQYTKLMKELENGFAAHKNLHIGQDHEIESLFSLAESDHLIPYYAHEFEKMTGAAVWNKDKAKCGATARAILYHFWKTENVRGDLKEHISQSQNGVENLLKKIEKNRFSINEGFLYFCESVRLDHVFIIQQTSSGKYRILQSFVNQYTLKSDLATEEILSFEELRERLTELKEIVVASKWTNKIEESFQHLFHSKPWQFVREEYNDNSPDFGFFVIPYFEKHSLQTVISEKA